MPLIEKSTYKPPLFLNNRHIQTILPSYVRKSEKVAYDREEFIAPDGEPILLDWSRVGSDKLLILSHGLCGHSRRHYVLSLVKAFNEIGWDCVAWNYRGTGPSPVLSKAFTTNDSTEQLGWVVDYSIRKHSYRKAALQGYSMGGNLCMLYLGRDADKVPPQVVGGVFFCATIDLPSSTRTFETFMGRIYEGHFVQSLRKTILELHQRHPEVDISGLQQVKTFRQFDDRYTAPMIGCKDAMDYWTKASACRWLSHLKVPTLLVNPPSDPFLRGDNFPVEEARRNPNLYLEMPKGGGHCGFITTFQREWWPATRTKEFLQNLV